MEIEILNIQYILYIHRSQSNAQKFQRESRARIIVRYVHFLSFANCYISFANYRLLFIVRYFSSFTMFPHQPSSLGTNYRLHGIYRSTV